MHRGRDRGRVRARRRGSRSSAVGEPAMKWNLRMVAAEREIWRATDLQPALGAAGLVISKGKMSKLWSCARRSRSVSTTSTCSVRCSTVSRATSSSPRHRHHRLWHRHSANNQPCDPAAGAVAPSRRHEREGRAVGKLSRHARRVRQRARLATGAVRARRQSCSCPCRRARHRGCRRSRHRHARTTPAPGPPHPGFSCIVWARDASSLRRDRVVGRGVPRATFASHRDRGAGLAGGPQRHRASPPEAPRHAANLSLVRAGPARGVLGLANESLRVVTRDDVLGELAILEGSRRVMTATARLLAVLHAQGEEADLRQPDCPPSSRAWTRAPRARPRHLDALPIFLIG